MQNRNLIIFKLIVFVIYVHKGNSNPTQCESLEWRCDNGQCIPVEDRCDGVENCTDGSDETVEHCIHFTCPAYAFRCAYGACILGNYACNNCTDCVDGSDETSFLCDLSLDKTKKERILQGGCQNPLQFECQKNECIERDMICDGRIDCSNRRDETVELCSSMYCSKVAFRCGYGGCIPGIQMCDGHRDCFDGADEAAELCNHTQEPEYCFIPVERKNLEIINLNGNRKIKAGDRVAYGTRLRFQCEKGWHLVGSMRTVCDHDGWLNQVPYCMKLCSKYALHRSISTTASCTYNDRNVSCDGTLIPGTIAKLSCAEGYMVDENFLSSQNNLIQCNSDGEWSKPRLQCAPICGQTKPTANSSSSMPWDVSIFRLGLYFDFQCYGTILSAKIVISAQKCFSDIRFADVDEHEMYNIVAGNYSKSYAQLESIGRPVFNVSEIYIPYFPANADSIAILVLVNFFEFSNSLSPICVQIKKFKTAPYEKAPEYTERHRRPAELGTSISETKRIGSAPIHYLIALWGSTHSDSRLNPINLGVLEGDVRKFVERYQNLY